MILRFRFIIFIFGLLSLSFLFKFNPNVGAAGEFATNYEVSYVFDNTGRAKIENKIELVNLTSKYFATQYSLSLGDIKIYDLSANDAQGSVEITQVYENNNTAVEVKFKNKVVGKDKSQKFSLYYKTDNLLSKEGNIREINIPKVGSFADISNYNVKISVPTSFGKLAVATPNPIAVRQNTFENTWYPQNIYNFQKDQLIEEGISLLFGEKQIFKFSLKYNLTNDNFVPQEEEVAIPQDSAYQKITLLKIEPKPKKIYDDFDGNWLASYKLAGRQNLTVEISGFAEIFPKQIYTLPKPQINPYDYYLLPQKFWGSQDTEVINKASQFKNAFEIYNFVLNHLISDTETKSGERLGGKALLLNPKTASSQDYSDLFITLARASKIPSRKVNGIVFSQNKPILHSWAEYWDENSGWSQIDPAIGKNFGGVDYFTKTDFNHLSLLVHGVSSLLPKVADEVKVELVDNFPKEEDKFKISYIIPKYPISIFENKVSLVLENQANTAVYNKKINISLKGAAILSDEEVIVSTIPPFSKKEVAIVFKPNDIFKGQDINIVTKINDQPFNTTFKTKSAFILLAGILILTCAFSYGVYQIILIRKKFRKRPKR